ncbi:hypothetical protein CK203_030000 [Vitis vinifera]|uniref:Uncharacterized protein n=1 Tax=Vitis vinifera TaxID=29760 RepID=A0A438IKC1_VITVI|nr:hypothetical protein CK203_030000 [Vitis vinifera]
MMEDSPCESFEPLDLPHVSTHGVFKEKVILEQKQVQESNSDPGNEITVRSDPPLPTQPSETSTDSTDNLDLNLPIAIRKSTRECTNRPLYPLSHYVSLKHLSPAHKNLL